MLCMPKTSAMPKRSIMPSLTISLPPPPPSSAGWKMTATEPAKLRVSARYFAAPSSMAVWPSWPQACILPGVGRGIGLAGRLVDRQRVHVGAQADRRARRRACPDDADHAGPADAGHDLVAAELLAAARRRKRAVLNTSKPSSGLLVQMRGASRRFRPAFRRHGSESAWSVFPFVADRASRVARMRRLLCHLGVT